MSVSLRKFNGDLDEIPCRVCDAPMLWMDHGNNVWCAHCEYWNGWFVAGFFCQPSRMPRLDPNGEPPLF